MDNSGAWTIRGRCRCGHAAGGVVDCGSGGDRCGFCGVFDIGGTRRSRAAVARRCRGAGQGRANRDQVRHRLRMVSQYTSFRPPTQVGMEMVEGPWFFDNFAVAGALTKLIRERRRPGVTHFLCARRSLLPSRTNRHLVADTGYRRADRGLCTRLRGSGSGRGCDCDHLMRSTVGACARSLLIRTRGRTMRSRY